MANVTEDGNHTTSQQYFCSVGLNGIHQLIFLIIFNTLVSITAFLGNALIITALPKVSSLYPPSKLLLRCLVCTDICVGLITQPIYITFLLSPENSEQCGYADFFVGIVAVVFSGVSSLTLIGISVDRLLALTLGLRYKQVVTLSRVRIFVFLFWLLNIGTVATYLYTDLINKAIICTGVFLCIVTSTFCYTKIYLTLRHHRFQVQDNLHQEHPNERRSQLNTARYRRTVSSTLFVQITFIACCLPFGIATALVAVSKTYSPSLAFFWELSFSMLMFNSSLNPILYFWRIREVRQAVKDTIRKCLCLAN